MNIKKEEITCPHCGKTNTWTQSNSFRPFCSERCKLIDLMDWADEKHRIPLEPDSSEDDIPESDDETNS
jgi:endogenous inhibitor of DNA gyrase (YacG/DUF329 family)